MRNFKKINELLVNITKEIYKRHDNNFLIILENWQKIVGNDLSSKSITKTISNQAPIIDQDSGLLIIFILSGSVIR